MTQKKILFVDDEPTIVKLVTFRLKANGYDVVTAVDGQEALDIAESENPDIILLNLMLPKINGYQVCEKLKQNNKLKNTPIIMLTARVQDSEIEKGLAMGASAYLTKPFEAQDLLDKIEELLA